ncbi:MAG TPA: hypothetical protein VII00_09045 [bacterium]
MNRSNVSLVFLLFLFIFFLNLTKIREPDVYWQVKLGEISIKEHTIPNADPFSVTKNNIRWVNSEWLSGGIFYLVHNLAGFNGLIVFKGMIVSAAFLILFAALYLISNNLKLSYLIALCAAFAARFGFTEHPHIFTYLFLSIILFFLVLYIIKGKRFIWLSLPLVVVWTNLNNGFILGLILFSGICFGWLIDSSLKSILSKNNVGWGAFFELLALTILSFIASLANPFFYKVYLPFNAQRLLSDYVNVNGNQLLNILLMPFTYLVILVSVVVIFYHLRAVRLVFLVPAISFFLASLGYVRLAPEYFLISAPAVIEALKNILDKFKWISERRRRIINTAALLLCIFLPAGLAAWLIRADYTDMIGFGKSARFYPEASLEFIMKNRLYGSWYNSVNFGGAVIFAGYPELKPFFYSKEEFFENVILLDRMKKENPAEFSDFLENYKLKGAMLDLTSPDAGDISRGLFPKDKWALVFWDDLSAVLVRRDTADDDFIKDYEIRYINPENAYESIKQKLATGAILPEEKDEIKRCALSSPFSSKASIINGMLLEYENNVQDAEIEFKKALGLQPNSLSANFEMALFYEKTNKLKEAVKFYKKTKKLASVYNSKKGIKLFIDEKIKLLARFGT